MKRLRYRQIFLFLVILLLPTAAIVVQSRRNAAQERENARQERELAVKRQDEIRKRTAAEIGKDILAHLERIMLQEIANAPVGEFPQTVARVEPAVAFVGWEESNRLVWPWNADLNRTRPALPTESEFNRKMEQAERAELREKDLALAAFLYREAIGN